MQESKDINIPSWEDIEASDSYKNLDYASRLKVRGRYFDDTASKNLNYLKADKAKQTEIRNGWMSQETPPENQNKGFGGDLVTSLEKGVLDLPGAATGLVDIIPAITTGERPANEITNAIGDFTGFKPSKWSKELNKDYSLKHRLQQTELNKTWEDPNKSGMDVAKTYIKNPALIANQITESIPSMLAGGAISKGLMIAGEAVPVVEDTTAKLAPKAIGYLERKFGKKAAAAIAGGIGEGSVQTGQSLDQAIGKDQQKNAVAALLSGAADALIGGGVGFGAQKLGFDTAETLMAKGFDKNIKKELALGKKALSKTGKIAGGAVSEGLLQEFPQSAQEQIWQNYADNKPIWNGVSRAAIEGALSGIVMGAGANVISSSGNGNIEDPYESQLKEKINNIKSYGIDKISESINKLNQDIINNNQLLQNQDTLDALAAESGNDVNKLIEYIKFQNKFNQDLKTRLQQAQVINNKITNLDTRIKTLTEKYNKETNATMKHAFIKKVITLKEEKNALLGQKQFLFNKSTPVEQEKEQPSSIVNEDKSAQVFSDNLQNEIVTQAGHPYQDRKILENQLAKRPDRADYIIAETPDGFIGIKRVSPKVEPSSFKDEQPVEQPKQVTPVNELENQLSINNQQLDFLSKQINDTPDPNEQLALRQEGALIYEQNNVLQKQLDAQNQIKEQNQYKNFPVPLTAETANTSPQFQITDQQGHDETYVKDAEGNDLIGFHGTSSAPFKTFDNNQTQKFEHGWSGDGHYFTVRKNYAQNYADAAENTTGNLGRLVKARFSFKNPLYKPSSEYNRLLQKAIGKDTILNKEDGIKATQAFKDAGYDAVVQGKSIDNSFEINVFDSKNIHYAPGKNQFQATNDKTTNNQIQLTEVKKLFPDQRVSQDADGKISVRFKNGKGLTIKGIQQADNDFIKLAIDTGQMSKNGKILGITTGTEILLNEDFADNKTLWHENKHVLDNLGMITKEDNAALNKEFNKLRKAGKLKFALSTHKDPVQRMIENRANMFAQIMTNREAYRNTSFGKVIQRVMDFFQQLLSIGKQTVSGLAREAETGKLYARQIGNNTIQTKIPQTETTAQIGNINNEQQLSLPITDLMGDKALRKGMPKFQTRKITDTEAFKKWFGKSKIVSNGQPHILYHGTSDSKFLQDPNTNWTFDTSREPNRISSPLANLGIFLGDDTIASAYAGDKGTIHPFFVKIENPYITTASQLEKNIKTPEDAKAMKKRLQELNDYDGIILKDRGQVIVFKPEQLKSATDNNGTFDLNNSDVRFEVREPAEQKLTDKQYHDSFKRKNNLIQDIKQFSSIRGHEIKLLTDKLAGPISTRLANANPMIRDKIRRLDFDTSQKIIEALHTALPLLEKTKDMSPADKHAWDLARKQADESKVNQIAEKYGMVKDVNKLRDILDKIREQAKDVNYDIGYINEYWPRIIKDQAGFLKATQGIADRPEFTDALKEKAKQMGITFKELNSKFPDVRADVISNMILGHGSGIGGPGNIKSRKYKTIPPELEKYYMNSDAALMQYIYSMIKKIEARKFFGKIPPKIQAHKNAITKAQKELNTLDAQTEQYQNNPDVMEIINNQKNDLNDQITLHNEKLDEYKNQRNYTENIGAYIDGLIIKGDLHKKYEKSVRDILEARFNEHGTTGVTNALKNMSYIDVMGNPMAALTQIGDLAWAAYVGKAWTPKGFSHTVKNIIRATLNKSKVTKEDLGIERIAQEFADGTTLGKAVNTVFKTVGLTKIDSIGKETLINNALMNYQEQIKTSKGRQALRKKIRPMFGSQTEQVIKDLKTENINSNNISDNVKFLLYSKLLDFQPTALSEMPELYLKGGNARIAYMLKTYSIKQMDVFRNEVFHDIKSKDSRRIMTGIGNMVKLLSVLTFANAGADELKDLVMGKKIKFKDNVIENLLTIGGLSKYMRMQVTHEGLANAFEQKVLPPFKFVNSGFSDIRDKIVTGDVSKGLRSVESIPWVGKWYYWHYGRGTNYKKTLNEQDFAEATKQFNKFKKQFDKAQDKRLFLQANINEFKQMRLHRSWQSALNKNKATINKLKKLNQTPAVVKRLDQLSQQRKLFYKRYFELAKQLFKV